MPDADPTPENTSPPELTEAQARERADAFRSDYNVVREQVGRMVVGQADAVDAVLTAMFAGGHALLEGVPGIGKTLLVRTLSRALDLDFGRIQFTPDLMPADVTGTTIVVEEAGESGRTTRSFRFEQGPVFAQILLADEINRATPKTQSAMLEAMQERSVTVQGTTHQLPEPFFVLATQNPLEQEGTYPLPEAQLDRFMLKIDVGYAGRDDLHEILRRTTTGVVPSVSAVLDGAKILQHQQLVRQIAAAPHVVDYAVRAVLATQPRGESGMGDYATPMVNEFVRVGASPRAAQSIMLGAKVRALIDGRVAASIDDVKWIAPAALRHRVIMNFEAEAEGIRPDRVVSNILETLPLEAAGTPS
ncbi:MAG: MoxR family ATPase [Planctomycetota bacterium]